MALTQVTVRQRQIGTSTLANWENFDSENQVVETARIFATPSVCKGQDGLKAENSAINSKIILDGNPIITLYVTQTCAEIANLT